MKGLLLLARRRSLEQRTNRACHIAPTPRAKRAQPCRVGCEVFSNNICLLQSTMSDASSLVIFPSFSPTSSTLHKNCMHFFFDALALIRSYAVVQHSTPLGFIINRAIQARLLYLLLLHMYMVIRHVLDASKTTMHCMLT